MPAILPILETVIPDDLRPLIESAPMPNLRSTLAQPSLGHAILKWELTHSNGVQPARFTAELQELILAALWLLEGDLDNSHRFSQRWETLNGSYWHAIMHRREGDWSNAKYWYRRAAQNPVVTPFKQLILAQHTYRVLLPELARPMETSRFLELWVDANRIAVDSSASADRVEITEELAWIEWQLLLAHCLHVVR